jgi:hypothetical protein
MTINGNKNEVLKEIEDSGELFNSNKEFIGQVESNEDTISILVHQKEDMLGRLKHESLKNRFQIRGLEKLKRGVVWNLSMKRGNINAVINQILETNILFNPLSHECHRIN